MVRTYLSIRCPAANTLITAQRLILHVLALDGQRIKLPTNEHEWPTAVVHDCSFDWKLRHDLMTVVQRSFNSNKKKTNERWPRLGHDIVLEIVAVDWTVNSVHCPRVVSRNVAIDGPLDIGHTTPSNLDGYCLSMSG